jgi:hypothetical protein
VTARTKYAIGAGLYFLAGYYALQLMGAPMDVVNELLKVITLSLLFIVGILLAMYALIDRWAK